MEQLPGSPALLLGSLMLDLSHMGSPQEPGGPDSQTILNWSLRGPLGSVCGSPVCREPHQVLRPKFWGLSGPGFQELPLREPSESPREGVLVELGRSGSFLCPVPCGIAKGKSKFC